LDNKTLPPVRNFSHCGLIRASFARYDEETLYLIRAGLRLQEYNLQWGAVSCGRIAMEWWEREGRQW
jgi:hypothetical protein